MNKKNIYDFLKRNYVVSNNHLTNLLGDDVIYNNIITEIVDIFLIEYKLAIKHFFDWGKINGLSSKYLESKFKDFQIIFNSDFDIPNLSINSLKLPNRVVSEVNTGYGGNISRIEYDDLEIHFNSSELENKGSFDKLWRLLSDNSFNNKNFECSVYYNQKKNKISIFKLEGCHIVSIDTRFNLDDTDEITIRISVSNMEVHHE